MMLVRATLLAVIGAATAGATPAVPPAALPAASPPRPAPVNAERDARLTALSPDNPWAYFELGEEIAAEGDDRETRALARRLYVLAYETARARRPSAADPPGADLRVSVCLALAAIADTDHERRWLHAIASSLGWSSGGASGSPQGAGAVDPAALDLATAMGLIRAGEGRRAAKLLEKPEVGQLLDRTEKLLSPAGISGGATRVRRLMAEWPNCAECKNRRFVKSVDGVRLCPTCGGKPGPRLVQQELLYQLRLESSLLSGVQKSWVAQTVVDGGAPLRDLDPDELAATYGVDRGQTLWRSGQWVAPEKPAPRPETTP